MRYILGFSATIMLIVAIWFIFAGFSIETTVPAADAAQYLGGYQGVSNLHLMHIQLLDVIIGVAAGLASCILYAGAAVVAAIEARAEGNPT